MRLETLAERNGATIPTARSKMHRVLVGMANGDRITQLDARKYGCTAITQKISYLINEYGWQKVIKKEKKKIGKTWWMQYYI